MTEAYFEKTSNHYAFTKNRGGVAKHDGTATGKRRAKRNQPPRGKGNAWIWLTKAMMESPAWRAMSLNARKVVDRIALEHMGHTGTENGELIVTLDDFERFGIRRQSVSGAIREASALGWIDQTVQGRIAWGEFRVPSRFGLTWLDRKDGTPASNRWKGIGDDAEAVARAKAARERKARKRVDAARKAKAVHV